MKSLRKRGWRGRVRLLACCGVMQLAGSPFGVGGEFMLHKGDILAANYGGNSLLKIDSTSGAIQNLGEFLSPTDVALAGNGVLFVSEWGGYVHRIDLNTGSRAIVNPDTNLSAVWGMVLHPDGYLIVSDGSSNSIVRIDPATGSETVVSTMGALSGVSGIDLLDAGHVVACSTFGNQLVTVALADGAQTVVPTTGGGMDMPRGVAVFGSNVFMTAYDSRAIRAIPASGGVVTTFFTATGFPFGMGVDSSGNIVTGTSGAAFEVLRVSPGGSLLRAYTGIGLSEVTGVAIAEYEFVAQGLTSSAPQINPIADRQVNEGVLVSLQVKATDSDWPPQALSYSLVDAPAGATITANGAFTWKPSEPQGPGDYTIQVSVSDDAVPPLSTTQSFVVHVAEVNSPPVVAPVAAQVVDEGQLLAFTLAASDPDLPAQGLTFSLEPGAPEGAAISPDGHFTWTPTDPQGPGGWVIGVTASDGGTPPMSVTIPVAVTVDEFYVQVSSNPGGPYQDDPGAVIDRDLQTIVVKLPPGTCGFYRLRRSQPWQILGFQVGDQLGLIKYGKR